MEVAVVTSEVWAGRVVRVVMVDTAGEERWEGEGWWERW